MAPKKINRRLIKRPIKIEDKIRNHEKQVEQEEEINHYSLEHLKSEVANAFGNSADLRVLEGRITEKDV